ncbi:MULTISPECIES: hypothetical protein [unclassified Arcicella]|uniref:hypothetical protein n=1 Tax=unclassified Arcicella TaxID=2644986 RepID=UPI002860EDAF|nr:MULTISPECIES: hypothetical protein [unclassified Arcicella]MDR6560164.1 hypothetical protein [Arcicella sp. BE51]MDR6810229.1 hypothetical protein [Arcicella sp. BE140]MDR6821579.1 hypothetical protein [Arcicella sp. BE139]
MNLRFLLLVACLLCLHNTFAQNITSPEEQGQIKQVIADEANYFNARNFEKWSLCFRQTAQTYWAEVDKELTAQQENWDNISKFVITYFGQNPKVTKASYTRENFNFRKVNPTYVWLSFDQTKITDGKKVATKELRIMELIKGEWKIVNRTGFSVNTEKKEETAKTDKNWKTEVLDKAEKKLKETKPTKQ